MEITGKNKKATSSFLKEKSEIKICMWKPDFQMSVVDLILSFFFLIKKKSQGESTDLFIAGFDL